MTASPPHRRLPDRAPCRRTVPTTRRIPRLFVLLPILLISPTLPIWQDRVFAIETGADMHPTGPAAPGETRPEDSTEAAEGPTRHDREFWLGIVRSDFKVPEGARPLPLILELVDGLGSPDRERRDTFGYEIPAEWIYRQKLLEPAELRQVITKLNANLKTGLGETGADSTLLRSFSALDLSVIAALDNEQPFLERAEFDRLLDAAIAYLAGEKDLRGYDPRVGWVHSTAHTADLLKFLARSRHLTPAGQKRILDAIGAKVSVRTGWVFNYGEDERMARAVLSIVLREDFDEPGFEGWLMGLGSNAKGLWDDPARIDTSQFASVQNTKTLLRSLYVMLASRGELPTPQAQARGGILHALSRL